MPLTLVSNPPDEARVVTKEAFGPLLLLLRLSDIDDVVKRGNNTDYGLAGAVWSKDVSNGVHPAEIGFFSQIRISPVRVWPAPINWPRGSSKFNALDTQHYWLSIERCIVSCAQLLLSA